MKSITQQLLREYDRDDPSDNHWKAAEDYKHKEFLKKNTLYSKPIEPLKPETLVYIKSINKQLGGFQATAEMYLTNNKERPYTYYKEKAFKFPLSKAQAFIDKHPKYVFNSYGTDYERHFEIEQA